MIFLCIGIFIIFTSLSVLLYLKTQKQSGLKKRLGAFVSIILLCVGLELSLFNVNFYESKGYSPTDLTPYLEEFATKNGDYSIPSGATLEFAEINTELNNIKIVPSESSANTIKVTVSLTDEANKYYFSTPERTIYKGVEKSNFIKVSTAGRSSHLALNLSCDEETATIKSVSVNEQRAFDFYTLRVFILVVAMWLLYMFMPSSELYKMKLCDHKDTKNSLVTGFLGIQCIVFIVIGTLNPTFVGLASVEGKVTPVPLSYEHHNQYDELAQAMLEGKVYIDNNDIPESLLEMENPYDRAARDQLRRETGDSYRWDVTFYNGHYYVYFGIVPLLLMYLPCRAIFDVPFPTAIGIIAFACIFALGVFKLLNVLIEKYFKKVSVGAYLLTSLTFINCCGAMFLVKRPDFYSIPIICAMAFIVWGIYFWIKGKDAEKRQNIYFIAGSLCCALAVGCRPQSVLACAVAVPLFLGFLFKDKRILSAKGIKNVIALGTPFVVVAIGIMYYNAIRFSSPFDFGSTYNLTTNDVTRRGFDIGRTGLGLFTYLFQTPQFTATFPFINAVEIESNYVGKTISELCFGGLITCTPMLWFTGVLPKVKNTLKEKKLFGVSVILLLVGFATVIADTQAGGLLQRYFSDFGYIFFIAAVLVIFALYEQSSTEETNKNLNTLLLISTILSVFYTLCLVFSQADVTIDTQRPELFGELQHLVEFWL